MRSILRVAVMAVLAIGLSAFAIVRLDNRTAISVSACGRSGPSDPAYQVSTRTVPSPPQPRGTDLLVTVKRGGQLVAGADVCASLDMIAMPMGFAKMVAKQVSPGVYNDPLTFGMPGSWEATLLVSVKGKVVVSKTLYFAVS
jgi:hypothetical protein